MKNKFLYLLLFFLLISCNKSKVNTSSGIVAIEDTADLPDQISHYLEMSFVDSSFTKAIIEAKRGRVYASKNCSILDSGIKVTFFSETGRKNAVLTATELEVDDITKNMVAKGNVVVISDSTNTKLETEVLEWDNERRKIHSQVFVTVTSPREIINGWGFESDENLNKYQFFKVNGVISK
ncbi:MAG: LPS export ABC transporter periplasmic protein LptC [Ignavibacteria bacterium]|jgi:LPS export ABC transporter protein LptC|nr:LPS export ABC transporter periplasmic protein LptC [Ignavibacteria bacterium]